MLMSKVNPARLSNVNAGGAVEIRILCQDFGGGLGARTGQGQTRFNASAEDDASVIYAGFPKVSVLGLASHCGPRLRTETPCFNSINDYLVRDGEIYASKGNHAVVSSPEDRRC